MALPVKPPSTKKVTTKKPAKGPKAVPGKKPAKCKKPACIWGWGG